MCEVLCFTVFFIHFAPYQRGQGCDLGNCVAKMLRFCVCVWKATKQKSFDWLWPETQEAPQVGKRCTASGSECTVMHICQTVPFSSAYTRPSCIHTPTFEGCFRSTGGEVGNPKDPAVLKMLWRSDSLSPW